MFLLIATGILYGQTTYYWVGGTTPSSYTSNSNWNTQLNGGGTFRVAAAANDILIFDGSNVGGATPTTGLVTAFATSTSSGMLILVNNANVNIGRSTIGSAAITINGDGTNANDLVVETGSTLTLGTATYNFDVNIVVTPSATALVSGTVYLSPLSTSVHTRSYITAQAANSVIFAAGAVVHISDSSATSGFNASVQDGVRFQANSSLYYYTGRSPIGSSSTLQYTNFDAGSNLYFMNTNRRYDGGATYSSSAWSNRKGIGNLFIRNNSTFFSDGPFDRIGDLTIDNGSTLTVHTSGVTPILGNLVVNGTLDAPPLSTNTVVMGGNTLQTISGTGSMVVPSLTVANYSNVLLARSVTVGTSTDIYGRINFAETNQVTGAGEFTARVYGTAVSVTGDIVAGTYRISNVVGSLAGNTGLAVSGNGLAGNTHVIGFSSGNAVVLLSKPATQTLTGVTFTFKSDTATLVTANSNGMDSLTGSVVVVGTKNFHPGVNYVINGATTKPFGISSGSTNSTVDAGFVEINAAISVNRSLNVFKSLLINGKLTLRPLDLLHLFANAVIMGPYSNTKYIATDYNASTGAQSFVQMDGINSATTVPVGTTMHYLPVTLTPTSISDYSIATFTGITSNGLLTGPQLPPFLKQQSVDAVWNINRISGTGNTTVQINWPTVLEGSTFTTLADAEIGLIKNNGTSWDLPTGTANNTTNIATANVSTLGSFSAGALPQVQIFVFNPIPVKNYGNADFNGGATSLNTTQPIVYTSSNPLVATIVAGNIHITGAGTAVITASQASDGNYPAVSMTQTLTVNKASLTVTADNKTKFEGDPNPALTISYAGFVLGETSAVLLTQPTITTTATLSSLPGTYPITVSGTTAANYNVTHVNGTLTVQPKQSQTITFNNLPVKTYGNADFAAGGTSTNNTIPIVYTSSNLAVATIIGNMIHITGAGTTTITASQAGNSGYFPATNVVRTLTVNRANLTIRVLDTVKIMGQVNPEFTLTFTGLVLGQNASNLANPPVVTTTALTNSLPGYYPIIISEATSPNYNITLVNGRLTVLPVTGTADKYINMFRNGAGNLTVQVYSNEPLLGDIVVYNTEGKPVARKNIFMPIGFISSVVPMQHLPSAVYIVTIKGKGIDFKRMIGLIRQ